MFDINGRKMKELFEPQYLNQVCEIVRDIVKTYEIDSFTSIQNHEFRMKQQDIKYQEVVMEQKKQDIKYQEVVMEKKKYEIEILRLRI